MSNESLPDKQFLQTQHTGVNGSMSAAAAPGLALAGVGKAVSGLGKEALEYAVKLQRVEDMTKLSTLEADYKRRSAEYRSTLTPGSDTAEYLRGLEKFEQDFQNEVAQQDLPQNVRDRWGIRHQSLSAGNYTQSLREATVMNVNNGKTAFEGMVQQMRVEGDSAGELAAWDSPIAQDLYSEEQRRVMQQHTANHYSHQSRLDAIRKNPMPQREQIENGTGIFEGTSTETRHKYLQEVDRAENKLGAESIERFKALTAGENAKIQTVEDFDTFHKAGSFPNLSDDAIQILRGGINRTRLVTQDELGGLYLKSTDLSQAIDSGKLTDKEHGERYMEMLATAEALPSSVERNRFIKNIQHLSPNAKYDPPKAEKDASETHLRKLGHEEIMNAMKAGVFGRYHNSPWAKRDSRDGTRNNTQRLARRELENKIAKRKATEAIIAYDKWLDSPEGSPQRKIQYQDMMDGLLGSNRHERAADILNDGEDVLPNKGSMPDLTPPPKQ